MKADDARPKTDAQVSPEAGELDTAVNLAKADEVKSLQHAAARALGIPVNFRDRLRIGTEGPEMVVIPSGHFRMGDVSGKGDRSEQPVHAVILKGHFAVGRYTVTFDEYDLFCDATRRPKPPDEGWGRGRQPVINVSWEDADAFCRWLSEQSGFLYRLPSEAEWEYAARGATESAYWWGETFDSNLACCDSSRAVPTDSFEPNPFGLYQVHSKVWEWVQDVWHEDYKDAPDDGSAQSKWITRREKRTKVETRDLEQERVLFQGYVPVPPRVPVFVPYTSTYHVDVEDRSAGRVLRGGSWEDQPSRLRSSARQPESKSRDNLRAVGFRVARDFD